MDATFQWRTSAIVFRPRSVEGKDPHHLVSCTLIVMGGALNTLPNSSKIYPTSINMNSNIEIRNNIFRLPLVEPSPQYAYKVFCGILCSI